MATSKINKTGIRGLEIRTPSATTLASGTQKTVDTFTLGAGIWLVTVSGSFVNNSTGVRAIWISKTNNGDIMSVVSRSAMNNAGGYYTKFGFNYIENLSESTTRYVVAYQNSGSNLSCYPRVRYVKLF